MSLPRTILNRGDDACQLYPEALYYAKRISQGGHQPVFKRLLPDGEAVKLCPGPSYKLSDHSQDGFNWGFGGSSPAQLALALLLDATTDPTTALEFYQQFKWDKVACWRDTWEITRSEILEWIAVQEKRELGVRLGQN